MSRTVAARSWLHKYYGTIMHKNFREKGQKVEEEDERENTMQMTSWAGKNGWLFPGRGVLSGIR